MYHKPKADPLICYYVHHHGSGHIMRAITIASALPDARICFIGSALMQYEQLIPGHIRCLHLPIDVAGDDEPLPADLQENLPSSLHYAPLGVRGMRERIQLMADLFAEEYPVLLIVDVSVEVALLARLAGIPVIVVRQHGNRTDPAHLNAYQSAELLVAPYGQTLADPSEPEWLRSKTCYAGGFSRFTNRKTSVVEKHSNIAILLGQGGTSIDTALVERVAKQCPEFHFHLIGKVSGDVASITNVSYHGMVDDPAALLDSCALVIGNAGHNTVMEIADLNKRCICIPEERPFEEQLHKGALLEAGGYAKIVKPEALGEVDWRSLITTMLQTQPSWEGITSEAATVNIATAISNTLKRVFP